jgi:hypothetical protein
MSGKSFITLRPDYAEFCNAEEEKDEAWPTGGAFTKLITIFWG